MNNKKIALIGGCGFVGTVIATRLAKQGHQLSILSRSRERAKHLWPLPNAQVTEINHFDTTQLRHALKDIEVVINLAGILNEHKDNGEGFRRAHVTLTQEILAACEVNNIPRYLHMSALNADPFGKSYYLRSKGEAEKQVISAGVDGLAVTIFRPSVIFGRGDSLFNRFASLLRMSPVLPLACAGTRLQPVYVGDVAEAVIGTIPNKQSYGQRYDLAGPEVISLKELVEYVNELLDLKRLIVPLGARLSKYQAHIFEHLPGKPFSLDNLRSASEDNVCIRENGLKLLDIIPTSFRAVVPNYLLGDARKHYDEFRSGAHR